MPMCHLVTALESYDMGIGVLGHLMACVREVAQSTNYDTSVRARESVLEKYSTSDVAMC